MVSVSTIMSTISFCQPHHHVNLGTCNSSEAGEFTAENILGRETLFFQVDMAAGVAEVRSVFPRFRVSS